MQCRYVFGTYFLPHHSYAIPSHSPLPPCPDSSHHARVKHHTAVQDTDPVDPQDRNPANGPDSKTIERYLEALCAHNRAQKLAIPITLTTSAEVTKKMMAYVKPGVQVNDALVEQVRRLPLALQVMLTSLDHTVLHDVCSVISQMQV